MPKCTERKAKEGQCQNWPGENLLPNFSMKIKVAPFVFTYHWQSIDINLFIKRGVPLRKLVRYRPLSFSIRRNATNNQNAWGYVTSASFLQFFWRRGKKNLSILPMKRNSQRWMYLRLETSFEPKELMDAWNRQIRAWPGLQRIDSCRERGVYTL